MGAHLIGKPVPPFGNPHLAPEVQHFHPNQELFVGPIPAHLHLQGPDNGNIEDEDLLEEDEEWGHWAMPPAPIEDLVDVELQQGEFLEMQDLTEPLDLDNQDELMQVDEDNTGLTISLNNSDKCCWDGCWFCFGPGPVAQFKCVVCWHIRHCWPNSGFEPESEPFK